MSNHIYFSNNSKENPTWADKIIMLAILVNCIIIFLQESGIDTPFIKFIDAICIVLFIAEMIIKMCQFGAKEYWGKWMNRFDFSLVILSIPALLTYIFPSLNLGFFSSVLVLRTLRIFRFFRLLDLFQELPDIIKSLGKAIKDSLPIFFGFLILILVFALISCGMFKDISPEYFGTPLDAIYSTFRICTTEGWYDIPDTLSTGLSAGQIIWVRIYFIVIVICGGIIGLSLVNSIFVDAMVSDNNKELEDEVREMRKEVLQLNKKINTLTRTIKRLQ